MTNTYPTPPFPPDNPNASDGQDEQQFSRRDGLYAFDFDKLGDIEPQAGTATDDMLLIREAGAGPNGSDYVLKFAELDTLSGVSTSGVVDDDVLTFDSGSGGWVPKAPSENGIFTTNASDSTPTALAGLTWYEVGTAPNMPSSGTIYIHTFDAGVASQALQFDFVNVFSNAVISNVLSSETGTSRIFDECRISRASVTEDLSIQVRSFDSRTIDTISVTITSARFNVPVEAVTPRIQATEADFANTLIPENSATAMPTAPSSQYSVAIDNQWVNSAQISGSPIYTYTELAIGAPGLILLDNTDLSLVTEITVSTESLNGIDLSSFFERLQGLDFISLSDYLDNTNFLIANITGQPEVSGITYKIPVSVIDSNGSLTAGELTSFVIQPTSPRAEAIQVDRLLDMESVDATQFPTGTGTANAITINYGPAAGTLLDPVMVTSTGVITVNETGLYRIKLALQYGRSGNAGVSRLLFAAFVNGSQAGRSISVFVNNSNDDLYIENSNWVNIAAGTVIEYKLMRDASGNNSGGLVSFTPTPDGGNEWNSAPCAALRVERWVSCDGTGGPCF